MEFLFSNYPPMKTSYKTFADCFYGLLPDTSRLDIAVGYVSSDSLVELQKTIELNDNIRSVNLIIGMHYFDKFTKVQYDAAMHLNNFLEAERLGGVRLVTAFRYHGKLYSYSGSNGPFAGIIGSNNLSSIVDGGVRIYESSILLRESSAAKQMNSFINELARTSTKNISELEIDTFNNENDILEGQEFVEKVSPQRLATILCEKTDVSFEIPIKPYEVSPQSNLNVFFGKGRESKNGLVKPRHWYEVELIVPKNITCQNEYPKGKTDEAVFTVITDDGWSFKCKVSGDYSKNFRSEGDLKILGKWLKGRLENAGVLSVGSPVKTETLRQYGRSTFTLTKNNRARNMVLRFRGKIMSYLEAYLGRIRSQGNSALADAIGKTVNDVVPQYISNFSFTDHVVSLLVGDVQSGKTSHMFGLMCAAADESFMNFILLTTDNILLQQQTLKRAERDLCDFCICDENDYLKFVQNNLKKPAVIVLKKNTSVLKQWKNNLSSTNFCAGNPLFIVDDEADAASLNTQVNRNKQSTINKNLEAIKKTTSSSIYMQVTGTPQSIFLQTVNSGWKPYFIYHFKPGKGYLGGNFFFTSEPPKQIVFTDNDEATEMLNDDEFPENGLKRALITHLVTSAYIMLHGGAVCNFLIHPSVKTSQHSVFAEKIGNYLNEIAHSYGEEETKEAFLIMYNSLKETKADIGDFNEIYNYIIEQLRNGKIDILLLNSKVSYDENTQYNTGINVIIGGNSLGRGVTFPQLQTIYYCRVAKCPQADTMWQHARMFGYDRDSDLMRVFMPPKLFKLFSDINRTNNSIIKQIEDSNNGGDIKIFYPTGLKPTRKNVLDKKAVDIYSGGVNYFPLYPVNKNVEAIDMLLNPFGDDVYSVNLKLIILIMEQLDSEVDDWNVNAFIGFVNTLLATDSVAQGKLIVRRNRDIGKGTGTLLSPTDRKLGEDYPDEVVLTMYKITGNVEKGWNGEKIWIPNIKLPGDCAYYSVDN